ncbi:homoserine dehydrogenase [[Clostridium] aminophilum]|uniref:homoserine dehydrogenase n=1 Tax=[Clostridium] aminophilum TaxID=1526 RepID=UPI0033237584
MIQAAVMGFGTIGSGVAEVLDINRDGIIQATGQEIGVKYILDLREFPDSPYGDRIIHDIEVILKDPEVQIVVETMGGVHPAFDFTKRCLEAGKHVVSSNKAVVDAKGTELLAIAREHHVNYLFEAAVGGGIPLIRPLTTSLKGETIQEISGILNGTTNYILTKMSREGQSFARALLTAQELGYAEKNPEADVEGHDTGRKIAILTALATGQEVKFEDLHVEGITHITAEDFLYAKKLGFSVKLVGTSHIEKGKACVYVCPVMVDADNPLYGVNDVYNGVVVDGKTVGKIMFYGSGAGKLPTANAVVSDLVDIAGHLTENAAFGWKEGKFPLKSFETEKFRYYIRISGDPTEDIDGVRAAFGSVKVIEVPELTGEFAVLTGEMEEERFQRVSPAVRGLIASIRVR